MSVYDMFIMMYYALDAEYEEHPSETLELFLSDANPFIFKGEGSADPSVYARFKEAYKKYGSDDYEGFSFVFEFIQNECPEAVRKAFAGLNKSEWVEAAARFKKNKTA